MLLVRGSDVGVQPQLEASDGNWNAQTLARSRRWMCEDILYGVSFAAFGLSGSEPRSLVTCVRLALRC